MKSKAAEAWRESFGALESLNASSLERSLRLIHSFIQNYRPGRRQSDFHFRQAVSLRLQALHLIERARRKRILVPIRLMGPILAFSGKFRFRIGRRNDYEFSSDGFSKHIANWDRDLRALKKRRDNRILEIGCFEGFSTCWILENLVRGKKSSVTCVNVFDGSYFDDFKRNTARTGKASHLKIRKGRSRSVLRGLRPESFDFIYVDGSARPADILSDVRFSWQLLKPQGIMTIDGNFQGKALPQSKVLRRGNQLTLLKTGSRNKPSAKNPKRGA